MTHPKHVAHDAQAAFEAFKAAGHDPVAECPLCHEMWQFMGTYQPEGGAAFHQFRHRCTPGATECGIRAMVNIPTDRIYPAGWQFVDGGASS